MRGLKKLMMALLAGLLITGAGCIWVDEDDDYDDGPCCGPTSEWIDLTNWRFLMTGEECPGGCVGLECTDWVDSDYYPDSIYLNIYDNDIEDIHLYFEMENIGYDVTDAWIVLCDDLGCEDTVEVLALQPGEFVYGSVSSAVLDSALFEYYDCLAYYGFGCELDYWIDVYLDQSPTCSPVTVDYLFEGLYIYD